MARNTDRNAYWTVGIPRHSATYQRLVADAKDKGVTVSALIAMRIDDFYKYGAQTVQIAAPLALGPLEGTEPDLHLVPASTESDEVTPPAGAEIDQEGANALSALDAW